MSTALSVQDSGATWIVMCKVSGGVTGTRQGPLKTDGQIVKFETKDAAQQRADALLRAVSPYNKATFSYWVAPVR